MTDAQSIAESIKYISTAIGAIGVAFAVAWLLRGISIGK